MKTTTHCSIVFALLALAETAAAQEVTRLPDSSRQSVGIDLGLEGAWIARASYTHRVNLGFDPDARVFGRFTLPVVTPDLGDFGIDGGLRAAPLAWRDFRLSLIVGPVVRHASNEVFTATGIGVGATVLLGYEGAHWGLSGEGGYEQTFATYLSHSDRYRATLYANAKDGWYAITGSVARAGLRGGARFGAVEIALRAGLNATGQLHALNPPFYFTLGGAYAF
jgi:hypothetical protein